MEEDPLTASSVPALVFAEAPDAGGEVEAESPRRSRRRAGFRQRLPLGRQRFVALGGAVLIAPAGRWRQEGELGGRAPPV